MAEPMQDQQFAPLGYTFGEANLEGLTTIEGGGVTSAKGFKAAGVHAGFRKDPSRLDFALVVADQPCAAAATFTRNVFCAAPVTVSREHLGTESYGTAQVLAVNSGVANAATGSVGIENAREMARIVSDAVGCTSDEVLVASTGVIGAHLPMETVQVAAPLAAGALSTDGGTDASCAIMTTDTHNKQFAVSFEGDGIGYPGCVFTVGGMAKGSGMIMPNMATMIGAITTDAPVLPDVLHQVLVDAVSATFNKITVDSDTSTNDSCFMFASGQAAPGAAPIQPNTEAYQLFSRAVQAVCATLARAMAADGEGATRLITVRVAGAQSASDADAAARTVANSPLVKTAVFGHDANWGRIAAALGRSGASFDQYDVSIDIMGMPVCRQGLTVPFDEEEALRRFERPEIGIDVDLGAGNFETLVWTCDLTHDYVTINGDYRT